jgi:hypothetical protein
MEQGWALLWWFLAGHPKACRPYITIDGSATVELDYSGMQPAMLYAMEGLQLEDDPYAVDGVGNEHRGVIKSAFMKLLNARSDQPIMPPDEKDALPDGWTWRNVQKAIIERHEPIRHDFRTGIGLELQRIDSDIAETVMMTMMSEGVLVLPIHDSFITYREERGRLAQVMKDAYRQRMGFEIEVRAKGSFWSI